MNDLTVPANLKAEIEETERQIREEDEKRQEEKAADILVHLQRMRNARIKMNSRTRYSDPLDYTAQGAYYNAMSRIIDLLDDFRIEGWTVPDFVQQMWDAERRA